MRLATHIASLFARSPIPVYEKELAFPCRHGKDDEEIKQENQSNSPTSKALAEACKDGQSASSGSPSKKIDAGRMDLAVLENTSCSSTYQSIGELKE